MVVVYLCWVNVVVVLVTVPPLGDIVVYFWTDLRTGDPLLGDDFL